MTENKRAKEALQAREPPQQPKHLIFVPIACRQRQYRKNKACCPPAWAARYIKHYELSGFSSEPSFTPPPCLYRRGPLQIIVPVVTKPQQVVPWAGWWGGAASRVRPRFPRLIRQAVNTQRGEGAEGRRPDGRRRREPEARPSRRKWGLMWKHPVQRGLDQ